MLIFMCKVLIIRKFGNSQYPVFSLYVLLELSGKYINYIIYYVIKFYLFICVCYWFQNYIWGIIC